MKTLIIVRGVPGCGKSTYAKELVRKDPQNWLRVNRDDFRTMANAGVYSEVFEMVIQDTVMAMARKALQKGLNVVTDDTNLKGKTVSQWHRLAQSVGDVEVIEKYIDVELKTALHRNATRPSEDQVPEGVVKKFFTKYINKNLKVTPKSYYPPVDNPMFTNIQDQSLPQAIVCDLDGTLAKMVARGPYDWDKVDTDAVNSPVRHVLDTYGYSNMMLNEDDEDEHVEIILFSARDGSSRDLTESWLRTHNIHYNQLIMREAGDMRKDSTVKKEMYEQFLEDKYNILFVLDDRDSVVELWRNEIGVPCFQVDYGNF